MNIKGLRLPAFMRGRPASPPVQAIKGVPAGPPIVDQEPADSDGSSGTIRTKWLELDYAEIGVPMRFATTGSSSRKRLRTLFTKEPITLAWMDTFELGQILYDVGANVHTVYAAVRRAAQVYAFEPEALNYAELNKNIYLNDLHGGVLAYCAASSDIDKADRLLLSAFGLGISYHDLEENSWTEDKQFAHDWGLSKDNRREQLRMNPKLKFTVEKIKSYQRQGIDGLNYIFYEDEFYDRFFPVLFESYSPGVPLNVETAMAGARAM
jgi:FkbM family methyltransferase